MRLLTVHTEINGTRFTGGFHLDLVLDPVVQIVKTIGVAVPQVIHDTEPVAATVLDMPFSATVIFRAVHCAVLFPGFPVIVRTLKGNSFHTSALISEPRQPELNIFLLEERGVTVSHAATSNQGHGRCSGCLTIKP